MHRGGSVLASTRYFQLPHITTLLFPIIPEVLVLSLIIFPIILDYSWLFLDVSQQL